MAYLVMELQTNASDQTASIITQKATQIEAESDYHRILSFAALSNVPVHAAAILTPEGEVLMRQAYYHDIVGGIPGDTGEEQ